MAPTGRRVAAQPLALALLAALLAGAGPRRGAAAPPRAPAAAARAWLRDAPPAAPPRQRGGGSGGAGVEARPVAWGPTVDPLANVERLADCLYNQVGVGVGGRGACPLEADGASGGPGGWDLGGGRGRVRPGGSGGGGGGAQRSAPPGCPPRGHPAPSAAACPRAPPPLSPRLPIDTPFPPSEQHQLHPGVLPPRRRGPRA
jgi:hypothetical protein